MIEAVNEQLNSKNVPKRFNVFKIRSYKSRKTKTLLIIIRLLVL